MGMNPITLRLPYPVSSNRYWRSFVPKGSPRAIVTRSPEANAFINHVAWLAKAAGCKPTDKPIELHITLIGPEFITYNLPGKAGTRRKAGPPMDLSNCLKVAEDALQGIAYTNDRQVKAISMRYAEPEGDGALIVRISEFIPESIGLFAEAL